MVSVFNLDCQTALKIMRENHPMSHPNAAFAEQLKRWEQQTKPSWTPIPAYIYHRDKIMALAHTKKFPTITKILKKRK